jgi:hypothetical protein
MGDAQLSVGQLLERYREAAVQTVSEDAPDYYARSYEAHSLYKLLRETEEGRVGLSNLMSDANPQVRRWAAAHSMAWDREAARKVLIELP